MAFSFEFQVSFSLSFGQATPNNPRSYLTSTARAHPSLTDPREAELSPTARAIQQRSRKQAQERLKREREGDAGSPDLLGVTIGADSPEARIMDSKSLRVLMRCTEAMQKPKKKFETPVQVSHWPTARRIKGLNETPLSYDAPFTTPTGAYRLAMPDLGNEFENFLASEAAAREGSELETKKPKRNSFSARLAASKSSDQNPIQSKIAGSDDIKSQADSVFKSMAKVEQQDAEDSLLHAEGLASAIVSPGVSPTSSIKHLPKSGERARGEARKQEDSGQAGAEASPSNVATGTSSSESEEPQKNDTPESVGTDASDGSDWQIV